MEDYSRVTRRWSQTSQINGVLVTKGDARSQFTALGGLTASVADAAIAAAVATVVPVLLVLVLRTMLTAAARDHQTADGYVTDRYSLCIRSIYRRRPDTKSAAAAAASRLSSYTKLIAMMPSDGDGATDSHAQRCIRR